MLELFLCRSTCFENICCPCSLQLDVSLSPPPDMKWGGVDAVNGSFNGMHGELTRGDADLYMSGSLMYESLSKSVHYSPVYDKDYVGWASPRGAPVQSLWSFLTPLDTPVWAALAAAVLGLAALAPRGRGSACRKMALFQYCTIYS